MNLAQVTDSAVPPSETETLIGFSDSADMCTDRNRPIRTDSDIRRGEANSAANCARCTHFEGNPAGEGIGWCYGFNVYTWPEPCPGCQKFEHVETEA
jgi:hypothetical protein